MPPTSPTTWQRAQEPQRASLCSGQSLRRPDGVGSVLPRKAEHGHVAHERGWEEVEQGQGAQVARCAQQLVGSARGLDRPDDAVAGSSHAMAKVLSPSGEDARRR
jgi:hypothetical protein